MTAADHNLAALPLRAYTTHPENGCDVIQIFRGEPGYSLVISCDTPERAGEYVTLLNRGILPYPDEPIRQAMIAGSMWGWDNSAAHPDAWRARRRPRRYVTGRST